MSFYLLPRTPLFVYKQIQYEPCEPNEIPTNIISQSLCHYLYNIKEKITIREKQWDIFKKYTNPYEYIHSTVPSKNKSVSKYKPISRSYFKMVELVHLFNIHFREPIHTFHLAEGPGGFIEAIANMRKCKDDIYIGMTLLDENKNDTNIPAWKKSDMFLKTNPNIFLENGADHTGNILSFENFEYIAKKYPSKMDLITADGGFDFSLDFNQQEIFIGKLLFAQIAFALCLQKHRGKFILKIFDCFMQHTVDLLYILSYFYEKVYITKPNTSRYANSEKYIVCIGFLHTNHTDFYPYLQSAFKNMANSDVSNPRRFLHDITVKWGTVSEIPVSYELYDTITTNISHYFIKKLEEYNAIFGQKQIQNIHYTLSMIDTKSKYDKIESLIKTNVQKSIDWCIKYNVPYNILNSTTNIFLQYQTHESVHYPENPIVDLHSADLHSVDLHSVDLHSINKSFFT